MLTGLLNALVVIGKTNKQSNIEIEKKFFINPNIEIQSIPIQHQNSNGNLVAVEIVAECHSDRANQTLKRLVREWRNLFIKPNLVLSTDPSATLGMTK
ncbi:MAG: hypothetical protein V1655_01380, partial [bacterium]